MTSERMDQLRLNHNFTGLEKSHALMECLNEIERLQALPKPIEANQFGKEAAQLYKVACDERARFAQECERLKADKQRLADEVYRLNDELVKVGAK